MCACTNLPPHVLTSIDTTFYVTKRKLQGRINLFLCAYDHNSSREQKNRCLAKTQSTQECWLWRNMQWLVSRFRSGAMRWPGELTSGPPSASGNTACWRSELYFHFYAALNYINCRYVAYCRTGCFCCGALLLSDSSTGLLIWIIRFRIPCCSIDPWANSFTLHCSSSLSCKKIIFVYLRKNSLPAVIATVLNASQGSRDDV